VSIYTRVCVFVCMHIAGPHICDRFARTSVACTLPFTSTWVSVQVGNKNMNPYVGTALAMTSMYASGGICNLIAIVLLLVLAPFSSVETALLGVARVQAPGTARRKQTQNVWRMLQAAESVLVIGTQFHNLCTAVDKHQPCDTNRSE